MLTARLGALCRRLGFMAASGRGGIEQANKPSRTVVSAFAGRATPRPDSCAMRSVIRGTGTPPVAISVPTCRNGTNVRDPDGHRIELYTSDYLTVDPDFEAIRWHLNDPRRQTLWGAKTPRSFAIRPPARGSAAGAGVWSICGV